MEFNKWKKYGGSRHYVLKLHIAMIYVSIAPI